MADPMEDEDQVQEGMDVEFEPDDSDMEETEDGGVIITVGSEIDEEPEFYENLAEHIGNASLNELATDLLDAVARDKESRSQRDKQYEEGLKRTGLGNDAPGGAQFQGASRVVHPILTEVSVDFAARVKIGRAHV